jgi:apolipoprotein N-acyltransferase
MIYPFFIELGSRVARETKTLKVGICQPYLLNKWIEGRATEHKDTLRKQTEFLSLANPDIILWPEASTPYPLNLDRIWVEDLAKKTGIPILAGSVIREEGASYNAMVYIDPQEGMRPEWYAKQVLVPFGEYIPKPFGVIPGLKKLVGPVGDFSPGNHVYLFDLPISDGNSSGFVRAGILICYEDIFPSLSRRAVEQGAELLIVSTNDAWFAEEGCAEQHASHSILRAVENKVPVVRCGNAGWSGWIDQRGGVRDVLLDDRNRVYFEGAAVIEVSIQQRHVRSLGLMGDQFAYICGVLTIILIFYFKLSPENRAKV